MTEESPATTTVPGYWQNETSGVLQPAVKAYLAGTPMTDNQIAAMRAYLRQWMTGAFIGPYANTLRVMIDQIVDQPSLEAWMRLAHATAIDPL